MTHALYRKICKRYNVLNIVEIDLLKSMDTKYFMDYDNQHLYYLLKYCTYGYRKILISNRKLYNLNDWGLFLKPFMSVKYQNEEYKVKLEIPEQFFSNENGRVKKKWLKLTGYYDSEDRTPRPDIKIKGLFKNRKWKWLKKWFNRLEDYIRENFCDFNIFVRFNYKSGKLEYCILFSKLALWRKKFRMQEDTVIFQIKLEELRYLKDTERVKVLNLNTNWAENNENFDFLNLETTCDFKELPKQLNLRAEDFKFQTICKEFY